MKVGIAMRRCDRKTCCLQTNNAFFFYWRASSFTVISVQALVLMSCRDRPPMIKKAATDLSLALCRDVEQCYMRMLENPRFKETSRSGPE